MSERTDQLRSEIADLERKIKEGGTEQETVRLRSLQDLLKVAEAAEAQVERVAEAENTDK
jgi:hypothetical protein